MSSTVTPLLTVTADAREKIDSVRTFNQFPEAELRIKVVGRSGPRLLYEIALEDPRDRSEADIAVELDGLTVVVDPQSAPDLSGATIDLDSGVLGGGLRVDNPNEGWKDPVAARVQDVLDRHVNPGVGMHGGMVSLMEVREETAYLRFGGGCQGCAAIDVTLKRGVEAAIRQAVPEIRGIVDVTDHGAGENPYYRHTH
jgi:Fe/S biogenesis protein NfuA